MDFEEYKKSSYFKSTDRCYNDWSGDGCKKLYIKKGRCSKVHYT